MSVPTYTGWEVVKKGGYIDMLYRVSFNTYGASYTRCFTEKQEAEKFYNNIKDSCSYNNVSFQEG